MELTPKEQKLVEEYRRLEADKKRRERRALDILQVATDYLKWLTENDMESSFNTFTDKYEYFAPKEFYEHVIELIELAYKAAK